MSNEIVYTSSTKDANALKIARVAAAGRIAAERAAEQRKDFALRESYMDEGQMYNGEYVEWCFICSRPTDHTGEHSPEQIAEWKERTGR